MRLSIYNLRAFQAARLLARLLPGKALRAIADIGGALAYTRNDRLRTVLQENLLPLYLATPGAVPKLAQRNVSNFTRMLADYFYCASRGPEKALKLIGEWRGYEHLEAARARGKGVIVVTAHLGNWELGGILLSQRGLPMTVITLDEPTTAPTAWRDAYRQRAGIRTIAVGPGREFAFVETIGSLRRNECLAMLVDRPYGETGIPVQLFGRNTTFSSGPALLYQHTGATIVPAFLARTAEGHYISFALPPVEMQRTADKQADLAANTQAIATAFEPVIRDFPDQWFHYVPIWTSSEAVPSPSIPTPVR